MPTLMIAAPASGSGKTVVTLGLLRHLRDRGVAVASAKSGPDYIDPAFHAAVAQMPQQAERHHRLAVAGGRRRDHQSGHG